MSIAISLSRAEKHAISTLLEAQIKALKDKTQMELHAGDDPSALQLTSHLTQDDAAANDAADLAEISLTQRDLRELAALESAHARLSTSDYGVCIDCAQRIPFARLRALPTAERCVTCQERIESTASNTPQ